MAAPFAAASLNAKECRDWKDAVLVDTFPAHVRSCAVHHGCRHWLQVIVWRRKREARNLCLDVSEKRALTKLKALLRPVLQHLSQPNPAASRRRTRRWLVVVLAAALMRAPVCAAQDAYTFYERAQAQFKAGEMEAAVVEIKNALQRDRSLLPAYILLSRIYLRLGAAAGAEEALAKAEELGADRALIWPLRAEAMWDQGKVSELLTRLPEEGFSPPVQAQLLVFRARALLARAELDLAESTFESARELAPLAWAPHVGLAKVALLKGDVHAAQARVVRATQVVPEAADAWSLKGDILHLRGDLEGALDAYAFALKQDPEHFEALLARTGILLTQARLQEGAPLLVALAERRPNDARVWYLQAVHAAKSGDISLARESVRQARARLEAVDESLVLQSDQLLMLAGIAHLETDQLERAYNYLSRYVRNYPRRGGARKLLAQVLLRQGSALEAIEQLQPLIASDEPDVDAMKLAARAHSRLGEHRKARVMLQQALTIEPDDEELRGLHALAMVHDGDIDTGLARLKEVFTADPDAHTELGQQLASHYIKHNQAAPALQVTHQLLEIDPNSPAVLNLHGTALVGVADMETAREVFESALSQAPRFVPAMLNLARLHLDQGRFLEAQSAFQRALDHDRDNVPAMLGMAQAAQALDDTRAVRRWLEKAVSVAPDDERAVVALASHHLEAKRFDAALAAAEAGRTTLPQSLNVLDVMARAERASKRADRARAIYRQMSEIAGTDPRNQFRIARAQANAGAYDDAMSSLERVLRHQPDHAPSRVFAAELALRAGRYDDALLRANLLLRDHPSFVVAHRLKGQSLSRLQRFNEALLAFKEAQALAPSAENIIPIGQTLRAAGRDDEAQSVLEQWLDEHPDDVKVEVILAQLLFERGKLKQAQRRFEHALAVRGDHPALLNNLANVAHALGDAQALDYARRAHQLAPDNAAISDTLGWVLVGRGEASEGLRYLRDAKVRVADDPVVRYHLAEALAAVGRDAEAIDELREAFALSPSFAGDQQARVLLRRLSP